jgi:hypothetical protein
MELRVRTYYAWAELDWSSKRARELEWSVPQVMRGLNHQTTKPTMQPRPVDPGISYQYCV